MSQYAFRNRLTIHAHQIIYNLLDDIKDMLSDLLPPGTAHEVRGEAAILQVFDIKVKGRASDPVAGCRILTGKVARNGNVRIVRNGEVIYDGRCSGVSGLSRDGTALS